MSGKKGPEAMNEKKNRLSIYLLSAGLVLCLLFSGLSAWKKQLYATEADSLLVSQKSIGQIFSRNYRDQSPLHFVLLHYWIGAFGDEEFPPRIPSVFFSLMVIVFVYLLGREMFDEKTAGWASLIMGFHPYLLYYGSMARMYSLMIFLSVASLYFCIRYVRAKRSRDLALFFVFTLLNLYNHFFAFAATGVELIWMAFMLIGKREWRAAFKAGAVWILLGVCCIPQFMRMSGAVNLVTGFGPSWGIKQDFPDFFIKAYRHLWTSRVSIPKPPAEKDLYYFLGGAGILFILLGWLRSQWRYKLLLPLWLLLPAVAGFYFASRAPISARYLLFMLPVGVLFIAHGISWPMKNQITTAVLAALVTFPLMRQSILDAKNSRDDWMGAMQYVESIYQEGDLVALSPTWTDNAFDYYSDLTPMKARSGPSIISRAKNYDRVIFVSAFNRRNPQIVKALDQTYQRVDFRSPQDHKGFRIYVYDVTERKAPPPQIVRAQDQIRLARQMNQEEGIDLLFMGDMMLGRGVAQVVKKQANNYRFPLMQVAQLLKSADFAVANLESPLAAGTGKRLPGKRYVFNASAAAIEALTSAGIDAVSFANNHSLDYGGEAAAQTVANLEKGNVQVAGVQTGPEEESQTPVILEKDGTRIALLAYTDIFPDEFADTYPGPSRLTEEQVKRDIQSALEISDAVVLSVHWGKEYDLMPNERQKSLGRLAIDSGASAVIGHHPHVLQPIEWYNGGVIAYSLGNFVFDMTSSWKRDYCSQTGILRLVFDGPALSAASFLPCRISQNFQPAISTYRFAEIPKQEGSSPTLPGAPEVLYDFRGRLNEARVSVKGQPESPEWVEKPHINPPTNYHGRWKWGKDRWMSVARAREISNSFAQDVVWSHPPMDVPVVIEFPEVPMGNVLQGVFGLTDFALTRKNGPAVTFEIRVAGESVHKVEHKNIPGWRRYRLQTEKWAGTSQTVAFEVSASGKDNHRRHFAFNGFTAREKEAQLAQADVRPGTTPVTYDFKTEIQKAEIRRVFDDGKIMRPDRFDVRPTYIRGEERGPDDEGILKNRWLFSDNTWDTVCQSKQKSGGELRDCLWAHPVDNADLLITYPQVQLGSAISGATGITDLAARYRTTSVYFQVYVDDLKVLDQTHENRQGWNEFRVDTSQWAGESHDVTFRISCENERWRHFCFDAVVNE